MTNPAVQLSILCAQRDAAADPAVRAALDAAIAALESQLPEHNHAGNSVASPVADTLVRRINTGGDYAEGNIDQRSGTFIGGDQIHLKMFFSAAGIVDPSAEQRELVASYLARLARHCDRLRLSGAVRRERRDAGPILTLSQIYVALASEAWVVLQEANSAQTFDQALTLGDPDEVLPAAVRRVVKLQRSDGLANGAQRGDSDKPYFRLERPQLLTEALSLRRQLVLLGGPGSGKSSFLRHMAVALAQGDTTELPGGWSAGQLLPIYASLGAFAAWTQQKAERTLDGPGLWSYLLATVQEYALEELEQPIKRAFRQGGLLLLLDGLDEVADPRLRAEVSRAVAALAEAGGYLAVTCRARSFEGAVAEPFAPWGAPVTLAPFGLGQMRHFVQAWYARSAAHSRIGGDEAADRAAELIDRLANLRDLRDLGQTPLLLTTITILYFYEGKLPEDRADLYEDLVQLLLTRWSVQRREAGAEPALLDRLKEDKSLGGLKEYHLRNTLEALAYRAHQQSPSNDGRGLLDRDRVRGAFQRLFEDFELGAGTAAEKTMQVLEHLEHESGLLLPEGGELYGLPHLSYEEYLAGCYLSRQADFSARAYAHWQADSGRWRETIFLALGRMVRGEGREAAAGWLVFLLAATHGERAREDAELQRAAFFACECLKQIGGKAALIGTRTVGLPALWQDLAVQLGKVVEGTTLPAADRVRAGVWLGELGDLRVGVCTLPLAMVSIKGASFLMGLTRREWKKLPKEELINFSDTRNEQLIVVADFELARYPVTNAQYGVFMEQGGYDLAAPWWDADARVWLIRDDAATANLEWWRRRSIKDRPKLWDDPNLGSARPNHPVVSVSWYEAMAFCRWLTQYLNDGYEYRLPNEAEWEFAARGTQRRVYSWGNDEPDSERANYGGKYNSTTAVGCFPLGATPEGVLDLAGNMWEWTCSEYGNYPYSLNDRGENSIDPSQKRYVLRGGSWGSRLYHLRTSYRLLDTPDPRNDLFGFRLTRHPQTITHNHLENSCYAADL
jgi:formylglycine-generating enzyme required for sulfatase activity